VIAGPNSRNTSAYAGWPGSMSLWASESASRTEKPSSRSMAATALLPLAIPPVSPSRNMTSSPRRCGRWRSQFWRPAAKARSLDSIAHEHGDGHRADPPRNRSERTGCVNSVGMNIANEDGSLGAEFLHSCREIPEKLFRKRGILNRVGADVDDRGAELA